jgi:hypothetical protein
MQTVKPTAKLITANRGTAEEYKYWFVSGCGIITQDQSFGIAVCRWHEARINNQTARRSNPFECDK